ncbi:hypothetical protein CRB1_88 [Mycobacterium phage CRB1]|uniref:hypothetical protein n=1 Tax=Mycobacterium phage CRB1 TaxID=1458841 RepID=UPI0003F1ECBB|nr:hypothetical protein CRB1_88 [Mycobacterium phage CRB1]AHJ86699.1 hypothetical protein CRB1_88 [Mycobacterium phage CRB1]
MTTRTAERMQTLSYILCDGVSYSWFDVRALDENACTAVIYTDEDDEGTFDKRHEIGPDDIARGLRLFREYCEGKLDGKRARPDYYGWELVKFDRTNGEDGDYDAGTADMVLQFAIFGEVIFG